MTVKLARLFLLLTSCLGGLLSAGEDWPQFMGNAAHNGDGADAALVPPLGLLAQVKLDDAVVASPAVAGGRVYVVDQMGTAYAVDPAAGKVLWKSAPDGAAAMGSNTASPCVANGRMFFATAAGRLHVLDANDGKALARVDLGAPVVSAVT